jgi:hypothetical protein
MSTYNNYSISRAKGKLYLKEKVPTEGYEEITYGTEGKKTYHQYHSSTKGLPNYFGVKEVEYQGRTLSFLELSLQDEGDVINKISVPLKNKGGYTDEVKAIISALDTYQVGEPITFTPNKSTSQGKNGKTYENLNIYINYRDIKNDEGKGQSTGFINYNDIPKAISSDDGMGGKSWDWKPVNVFYHGKLKEIEERFTGGTTQSAESTQKAPVAKQPEHTPKQETVPTITQKEKDELPF